MSADSLPKKNMSNRVIIPSPKTQVAVELGSHHHLNRNTGGGTSGHIVRPQSVTEKTLLESVAGLINEVGLVPQPYSTNEDKENSIVWTKFEQSKKYVDLNTFKPDVEETVPTTSQLPPPLFLTLAYPSGIQMWAISMNGEAQEVLSWKRPAVRLFQLLPSPAGFNAESDQFRDSRPIVAIVEGSNSPSCPNQLNFISLKTGDVLKNTKFIHPVCDLLANSIAIVISFLDKIIILDPYTLDAKITIPSFVGTSSSTPSVNPIALGSSWLAFTDRKLQQVHQSLGGVETAGASSYTATVIYAAKSLTKGLKGLGETVANSITGHRIPTNCDNGLNSTSEPGVVTIVNIAELKSNQQALPDGSCTTGIPQTAFIAHFVAHMNQAVLSMSFDPSGLLMVTADKEGHDFHVFRIHPHPLGSSSASVHHLYVLHRGDTGAKVQNISFSADSRWVAISTLRGTTHIFPITPYGGSVNVRTHSSHRVVNRLSRFHRTAGLDDTPTSGRNSPVLIFSPGGNSTNKPYDLLHLGSPYPNPRLPPLPHPVIIPPLAQLRQSFNISSSPKGSPPISKSKGLSSLEERIHVVSTFEAPRGWFIGSQPLVPHCDKRKKSPVDAVFVMTCHGALIEYSLEPKPQTGIPKDKVSDDTPIELAVHAKAQWSFTRPTFHRDLYPPLSPTNLILSRSVLNPVNSSARKTSNNLSNRINRPNPVDLRHSSQPDTSDEGSDEKWLSQVEITTHSGPHRRLWMGPQFTFKVFNPTTSPSGNQCGMVDVETVEVNVTNRPAKSNPVNMPVSSSLLPVVIEGSSGSSLDQSPRLIDPYNETETCVVASDSQIKESLADAMMENCAISSRENGGCQSLGSCDDEFSSSSFDSSSQHSIDAPLAPSFCIEASLPFPD